MCMKFNIFGVHLPHAFETSYDTFAAIFFSVVATISFVIFINITKRLKGNKIILVNILISLFMSLTMVLLKLSNITLPHGSGFDVSLLLLVIVTYFYGLIPSLMVLVTSIIMTFINGGTPFDWLSVLLLSLLQVVVVVISFYWRKYNAKFLKLNSFLKFWILGMVVNILHFLVFPFVASSQEDVIHAAIPLILFFPVAIAIIGVVTEKQEYYTKQSELITQQKTLLDATVNATNTMEIYAVDRDYNYLSFNHFHEQQMFKFSGVTIKNGDNFLKSIKDISVRERLRTNLNSALEGREFEINVEVETKKGKFLEEHFTAIFDEDKNIIGVTVFSHEITERKQHEKNITYLSYHDLLTGLKNRRFFDDRVNELSLLKTSATVVYIDINALKIMNDAFGHTAGDDLLKTVSISVLKAFGDIGDVCRIGGDEIVILLPKYPLEQVRTISEIMKNELEKKVVQELQVSISIGVAEAKTGEELRRALLKAEDEMYKNK